MPKLDLKALIAVKPAGSQAVIALLVLLCGYCLWEGFAFWRETPDRAWLPFSCAGLLFVAVLGMWGLSRRDIDSAPLRPTNIVRTDGGRTTEIATDSRNLRDSETLEALERMASNLLADGNRTTDLAADGRGPRDPAVVEAFETRAANVRYRGPLPSPDGFVDGTGRPIPQSASDAKDEANAINARLREQVREIERGFANGLSSGEIGPPGPAGSTVGGDARREDDSDPRS